MTPEDLRAACKGKEHIHLQVTRDNLPKGHRVRLLVKRGPYGEIIVAQGNNDFTLAIIGRWRSEDILKFLDANEVQA